MKAIHKALIAGMGMLTMTSLWTIASAQTQVTLQDGRISPTHLTATKGVKVEISIQNKGAQIHNFVIPDFYIFTHNLQPGERTSVSFVPDKTGAFSFYSDRQGVPEPGMQGTMTVSERP
ncbi:cupredoxin domain-containing protein [Alicyclobacillus acidiphilus]|uniref:cupredoxin domain-containing protein n=1 Tax=Alicyclobacillus acidiphilus TaxID=182455 RepID=UPI00082B2E23|nr:cupredoxin domain-containing protein [Alicyclobacillus acidiphilus]